jgi:hypothetical protein
MASARGYWGTILTRILTGSTKREAAYKYNFSSPKYLVVSTEDKTHKDKCGNRKGYRMKPKRLG